MRRWSCTKLNESGYEEALFGLSLSHNADINKMPVVLKSLAFKGGGHSKALESIMTWWRIEMPRYWWQEFDTYRVGITKQSASTMHTIMKRELTQSDFVEDIPELTIDILNSMIYNKDFRGVKINLPEGFLQVREMCVNYMSLQNIIRQRKQHKLLEWNDICGAILLQVGHPELLVDDETYSVIIERYKVTNN